MKFPLPAARYWGLRFALLIAATSALPSFGHAQTEPESTKVENSAITAELLYEILVGELNLRQGEPGAGFSLLLDAARKTNDVQLFSRAVDVALQARSGDGALMAARAWSQAWPEDRRANSHVLQIMLALNQVSESLEPLNKALELAPDAERKEVIGQIPRYYARLSDKVRATEVVQQALEPYLKNTDTTADAWTSVGRMRLAANDVPGALKAAQAGHSADVKALSPLLLALELMGRENKAAEQLVKDALPQQSNTELTMSYVRVLIELQRYPEATQQLLALTDKNPKQADAWLILGSLQYEAGQDKESEASLARYINLVKENPNALRGMTQAQSRRAAILARHGKISEARQLIAQLPANNAEEQRSRSLAEVQLLRDHNQWQAAYDVLSQISGQDPDLIYEQAMMAEKLKRLDDMEKLLRQVIEIEPAHHNAYNALGFSLADRNIRLPEAKKLIIKALTFVPDDAFITDSMGWVEFRLGNLSSALSYLEKAYKSRPDAEIAAHLGEVLWKMKRRDEALKVWREGIKTAPNNETLQETLQRLKPPL